MELLLKRLEIDQESDIEIIKEQLEFKQLEYLSKLDIIEHKVDKSEKDMEIEKKLENELNEIEEAIKTIAWTLKKMSTGLSLNKTEDKKENEINTNKEMPREDLSKNYNHDADLLCDQAHECIEVKKDYKKALELYRKAEKMGSLRGKSGLGKMYLNGWGVPQDVIKALELNIIAANQGDPAGQNNLAYMYYYGKGVEKDLDKAVEWYKKAAEQDYASAQTNLAIMYKNGEGVKKDLSKAVELYKKAAEQGDARAQTNLGYMYSNGKGVKKDLDKAVEWYKKAAEQDYAIAQYNLGIMYKNGKGVEKDLRKAIEWYTRAAEQDYASAQTNLAIMYKNGEGVKKDLSKAVELYKKAAEQGDARAQTNLGYMYSNGKGVKKDLDKAVELYTKAAQQGDASAQYNLAIMYETGKGVDKDLGKAVELYIKAAQQGDTSAQNNLGVMYKNGEGVKKDLVKAVKWYTKAAEQGNARAQRNLGDMYEKGKGVTKNLAKAVKWYLKSAEQDNIEAQKKLGHMYYYGDGVSRDYDKAAEYYRKLVEQGGTGERGHLRVHIEETLFCTEPGKISTPRYREVNLSVTRKPRINHDLANKNPMEIFRFIKKIGWDELCNDFLEIHSKNKEIESYIFLKRVAEEENNPIGYKYLGDMYLHGYGTEKNYKEAFRCYKIASKSEMKGVNFSKLFVEVMNKIEKEMIYNKAMEMIRTPSFKQAIDTLIKIADKGYADAQFEVGRMYMNGYRLSKDLTKGEKYMIMAYKNGHPEASQYLDEWIIKHIEKSESF